MKKTDIIINQGHMSLQHAPTPHKSLPLLAFPVRNRSQLCGTRPAPQPSYVNFPLWSSPHGPLPTVHPCSPRPHLYSVASTFCVLRPRRVWVRMSPSEHEGLAQTVAATEKGEGSLYDILARINSSLISQRHAMLVCTQTGLGESLTIIK